MRTYILRKEARNPYYNIGWIVASDEETLVQTCSNLVIATLGGIGCEKINPWQGKRLVEALAKEDIPASTTRSVPGGEELVRVAHHYYEFLGNRSTKIVQAGALGQLTTSEMLQELQLVDRAYGQLGTNETSEISLPTINEHGISGSYNEDDYTFYPLTSWVKDLEGEPGIDSNNPDLHKAIEQCGATDYAPLVELKWDDRGHPSLVVDSPYRFSLGKQDENGQYVHLAPLPPAAHSQG